MYTNYIKNPSYILEYAKNNNIAIPKTFEDKIKGRVALVQKSNQGQAQATTGAPAPAKKLPIYNIDWNLIFPKAPPSTK